MKSLTSKFLAVALLLSVVSPVGAFGLEGLKQKASDCWDWTQDKANTFHENVTKPYEAKKWAGTTGLWKSEHKVIKGVEKRIKNDQPTSFTERASASFTKNVKAPYRLFTSEHNRIANGIYYPLLAAAAVGTGYGIYKGAKALKNWWTGNEVKKYEQLQEAGLTIIDAGEGSLTEVYDELKLKSTAKNKALYELVKAFDLVIKDDYSVYGESLTRQQKEVARESILDNLFVALDRLINPAEVAIADVKKEKPAGK